MSRQARGNPALIPGCSYRRIFMKLISAALTFAVLAVLLTAPVHAQATRTWVSGVGDDLNPCSRTAPCKTFAGAISKTAAGGEISVLDPGGYGTVTITKPITISGVGTHASILSSSVQGVVINITSVTAPQTNTVTLRNIQINGAAVSPNPLGTNAVHVFGDTTVILDHVNIYGFAGNGLLAEGTSKVSVVDAVFFNNSGVAVH